MSPKNTTIFISRLMVLLLCAVLVLPCLPAVRAAESGTCGDGLSWSFNAGTLTVSGSGSMTNFRSENMAPWYGIADRITQVVIGEGVSSVGRLAFYGCRNLTTVSLPGSLNSIGELAFKNCESLTYIPLPGGLRSIGEAAFESCLSLADINLPESLQSIGSYAFYWCKSLRVITVPAGVTRLGNVAFAYCESLVRAVIRCPITKLPDATFFGCTSLVEVVIPETVQQLGDEALTGCENLSTVTYPAGGDALNQMWQQMEEIQKEDPSVNVNTITPQEPTGGASSSRPNNQGGTTHVEVNKSENSTIIVEEQVNHGDTTSGNPGSSIQATVQNPEGWNEMKDTVEDTLNQNQGTGSGTKLPVNVQLGDSQVSGGQINDLAGKDVELDITTGDGDRWKVDMSDVSSKPAPDQDYDLNFTVTETDKGKDKVGSDTIYEVTFDGDTDFKATVGVGVGSDKANQNATLFQKDGSQYTAVQTVVVDRDGKAWFNLANVDSSLEYLVAMDSSLVSSQEAIIPKTMYDTYGMDPELTLTDQDGNYYAVTGRNSKLGFGLKELLIGVVVFMVITTAVVGFVMYQFNKSKTKNGYIPQWDDEEE